MLSSLSSISIGFLFLIPLAFEVQSQTTSIPFRSVRPRSTNNGTSNATLANANGTRSSSPPTTVKVLYDADSCYANFIVEDGEGYLLFPSPSPHEYECQQTFTVANNDSSLIFTCKVFSLRFYCDLESLQVETENTTFKFCSNAEVPTIAGKVIKVKYERNLFGLHGTYICTVIALSKSKPYMAPFLNCMNCGVTALKNGTRTVIIPDETSSSQSNETSSSLTNKTTSPPRIPRSLPIMTRVVGGVNAQVNEYPWMAYIEIVASDGTYACGGSLITDKVVVTAAHCLDENGVTQVRVYLGVHDLTQKNSGQIMRTKDYALHPAYDSYEIVNDIAIIRLPTSVIFTQSIKPACLPSEFLGDLDGLTATATGWGYTQYDGKMATILQTVQLSIWSFADCSKRWNLNGVSIRVSQMCAYGVNKDTCSGDSGGPLIVTIDGRWILIGITSFGYECATPGLPGVYTRVSKLVRWVKEQINDTACQ